MAEHKKNSLIIGYNYILFQSNLNNFVKCWYDGSDEYDYIYRSDFIKLFEKVGSNYAQLTTLNKYLDSTNLYVWDVDANYVAKVTKDNSVEHTIGKDINNAIKDTLKQIEGKSKEFSINSNVDFL